MAVKAAPTKQAHTLSKATSKENCAQKTGMLQIYCFLKEYLLIDVIDQRSKVDRRENAWTPTPESIILPKYFERYLFSYEITKNMGF